MNQIATSKKMTYVCAYLILRKNNHVLLLLRQNTGYCDGQYGLVSGHVEDGEGATSGMIREAKEEASIELLPAQLKVVHIVHRYSNRQNIDIFFECTSWSGEIKNQEPAKCGGLEFFPVDNLPENTIPYIARTLQSAAKKISYSEEGWE
ncbi:MAG TPA: NUDIX domain-containing protein [Rhabdochlamydiaceae bacterium]|jgi:ADP-ribose pyrophosphatase YjhB (NUDIX family)|nr:NUDIX domain-containing protein [Rhabdochlamydiaceae bacterium]